MSDPQDWTGYLRIVSVGRQGGFERHHMDETTGTAEFLVRRICIKEFRIHQYCTALSDGPLEAKLCKCVSKQIVQEIRTMRRLGGGFPSLKMLPIEYL